MNTKITSKIPTSVFIFLALILFGAANIKAAPGDLDLSFGSGGFVVTPIGPIGSVYEVVPREILTQPDGKIVVCGWIYDDFGTDSFFLARYNPNGTLDASFGTNGQIIPPDSQGPPVGYGIALQPDGKIITVGSGRYASHGLAVYRYNANGTLDDSFGAGGVVITLVGTDALALSVAVQADGKIVVVGYSYTIQNTSDFTVVRYNPNGSLDTSFNGTGIVTTSFGGDNSFAYKVILQPDGKIVAAGSTFTGNSTFAFALARYNPDGSLDPGFGAGGKIIHAVSIGCIYLNDAALQPDGKIVASGLSDVYYCNASVSAIVRYNTNGSIDTSFAQNGVFTTEENFVIGNGIALQPDGKLIAFGYTGYYGIGFAIVRLNPNGTPDTSFGINGRVITPIGTSQYAHAVDGAVQSDGKILAFGVANNPIAIVRYLGDSAAPRAAQFDFDGDRRADVSVFRPSDRTWYLNQSTNGFSATQFGLSTDKITPADFDGDGKSDLAVYRDGSWYLLRSSTGFLAVQFGLVGDIPQPADFDGDGRAELAVYRGGSWFTLNLANNQFNAVQLGLPGDKPVVGDYDGDGRADQAIYRDGVWYLNRSTQGFISIQFGLSTDRVVPADYDGDGKTDPAVYRDGTWYVLGSQTGFTTFQFGLASDIPAPADYDGDGRTDAAVYRDGVWYLRQSTAATSTVQFGQANDLPVPSAFVP